MNKFRGASFVMALVLLMGLLVAACGGAAPAPTVTVTNTVTVTPSPSPTPTSSPSPTPAARPAWELDPAIVAAAKKEGALVLMGTMGADDQRALRTGFNKLYPEIKVEFVNLRGPDTEARIKTEKETGKRITDIAVVSMRSGMLLKDIDMAQPFEAPESKNPAAKWVMHPYNDPLAYGDPTMTMTSRHHHAVAVNTNLVPPAQEPKTWNELFTDPKWKGKMVMGVPNKGAGLAVAYFFWRKEGTLEAKMDLIEKVKQQNIFYSEAEYDISTMVARGEYSVILGGHTSYIPPLIKDGMPLKFLVPQEGATAVGWYQVISKMAPHPNAAKLFLNWLLTEDGQKSWVDAGRMPIRSGIPVPAWIPTVSADKASFVIDKKVSLELTPFAKVIQKIFGL